MAARIQEMDFGTKPATRKKMREMQTMVPSRWQRMMTRYWTKVYQNTIESITEMGAVDTGALRQSIRLIQNVSLAPGLSNTGNYEIGRGESQSAYIVAGGGGVINPRHKREVDYAQAVHDGYFKTKASKKAVMTFNKKRTKSGLPKVKVTQLEELGLGGGWVPGRPFLDDGIRKTEPYLEQLMKEYMDGKEHAWESDQPLVNPYSASMIIGPSKYGG